MFVSSTRATDRKITRPLVCIDCRYIRERPSGIGAVVQGIIERLPELAPDLRFLLLKHELAPSPLSKSSNVEELTVPYEANGPMTLLFLSRVVDLKQIDLFHATFNILPRGLRVPSVVTVHDLMWLTHPAWARTGGLWGHVETVFYRAGIEHALREATRIVAVSQSTAAEIEKCDPEAAERCVVIPPVVPSIDGSKTEGPSSEVRGKSAAVALRVLGECRRYVLVVGQFSPYKNHEVALRAFAAAFADQPDVELVFVHRLGNGRAALGPVARRLGIEQRVHFFDTVSEGELDALYRNALVLCHPSLHEGFGLPVAEAMARGCPVVCGNRGALPEVTAGAALLVDPEDVAAVAAALRRTATNPALAEMLRRAGLKRIKDGSARRSAELYANLYREVLATQPGRATSAGREGPPRAVPA
jgi:glycosyltransferase involved in cell wall biosynthesis